MVQSKYDVKVKEKANSLKMQGWKVKADVGGYDRPDPIGKYKRIQDIQAEKAGARKIIEVEIEDTMQRDKKQQGVILKSAAHRKRTSFEIVEV